MKERKQNLELLAKSLDISPSMYQYAVDRYRGMTKYLINQGIEGEFSPQGSFRTGTVTRPYKDGKETDFDIDLVCKLSYEKCQTTPKTVKCDIGDCLGNSKEYGAKLLPEDDRCWTLLYADVADGIGLVMDVVPCVGDDEESIANLLQKGVDMVYAQETVSITERIAEDNYTWQPSNPEGYGKWFDDKNKKFMETEAKEDKERILKENRSMFRADASVADVPDYFVRTSLQKCIQLLKRHRDIYYQRRKADDNKVASVIITTLAAQIAYEYSGVVTIDLLLSYIISGMKEYALILQGKQPFKKDGIVRAYISKEEQKWKIPNPVNPDDNYADSWTDDTAKIFFQWVDAACADFSISMSEDAYWSGLENGLGKDFVRRIIPLESRAAFKAPQHISSPVKPWGINKW